MIHTISLTVFPGEETDSALLRRKAAEVLDSAAGDITHVAIEKKSLDARRRQIKLHLRLTVFVNQAPPDADSPARWLPPKALPKSGKSVVILGCGPAGLFAALRLLERGVKPVLIERGRRTGERKRDIADIGRNGAVDPDSNYCFGEGGAGTFSDGKLYSRSNKRGNIPRVLAILHYFGADEAILTDAHAHIGSDRLPTIIAAMTDTIGALGGEIRFETRCTGLILANGPAGRGKKLRGIRIQNRLSGEESELPCGALILAPGHSAPDIYRLLAEAVPGALETKTFALGIRVEHPRSLIDKIQYHGEAEKQMSLLPAAEYRLTAQIDGRGVYSFCMCPGGIVVPSASGPGEVVVNGMSPAGRNTRWSNAALVVETRPEDIPGEFWAGGTGSGADALAGLRFREWIERTAFTEANPGGANGNRAPAQALTDFLARRETARLPPASYAPGLTPSRLDRWLPEHIARRLQRALPEFDKKMRGFISPEALLIAPETRTSTPARILRNPETFECPFVSGLYPAGEGSGYAGGIVSSALDGENAAEAATV
jgi:uncharacterized FAD-dependent dehydrogenase